MHGKLIWGDNCIDKRHFDCVGLVNAAWARALGWPDVTMEIFQWAHATVTQQMSVGSPLMPGDILCAHTGNKPPTLADHSLAFTVKKDDSTQLGSERNRWHHIGICVDNQGTAAQAEKGRSASC